MEGFDIEPYVDALIADDSETFAEHCIRLLTDAEFAASQAHRAHLTFCKRHSADRSITAVVETTNDVLRRVRCEDEIAP